MKIKPIQFNNGRPRKPTTAGDTPSHPYGGITFGILQKWHPTLYGDYKCGYYKGFKYEVYDAKKYDQKLIYVSDKLSNWVKSKLIYIDNGIKKIVRAEAK